jgi:DNA-directed RNA polymerase subunit RPC12/RpoP
MGNRLEVGKNDLASQRPELLESWNDLKNLPLTPETVSVGSSRLAWWTCSLGHEWNAIIGNRAKGVGCPVCSGKKVLHGFNDLETLKPSLAKEWHPSKNLDLKPSAIVAASNFAVWWMCSLGHEWKISPNGRRGRGCPVCGNKKVQTGVNDLLTSNPELASQFHPQRNGTLSAENLVSGSNKRVWWICKKGHEWQNTVKNRNRGQGCPFCSGRNAIKGKNDLQTLSPTLAKEWVTERNLPLKLSEISGKSGKRVWWRCSKNHEFQAIVQDRFNGNGCPYCSGQRVLIGFNDLLHLKPELASQLSSNADPYEDGSHVTVGSRKILKWTCSAGHDYKASVYKRADGRNCPYCSNKTLLVGFNDLASQHPELASQIHPTKNKVGIASELVGKSNKSVWWICPDGHEWRTTPEHRIRGRGCPTCAVAGYTPTKAGYFYFIANPGLAARKVGIANKGSDRLETFAKSGWLVLAKWESENGVLIQELETLILRWIRKELGLPQFLTKQDMGKAAGWSETFSDEGVSNISIQVKIDQVLASLKDN